MMKCVLQVLLATAAVMASARGGAFAAPAPDGVKFADNSNPGGVTFVDNYSRPDKVQIVDRVPSGVNFVDNNRPGQVQIAVPNTRPREGVIYPDPYFGQPGNANPNLGGGQIIDSGFYVQPSPQANPNPNGGPYQGQQQYRPGNPARPWERNGK